MYYPGSACRGTDLPPGRILYYIELIKRIHNMIGSWNYKFCNLVHIFIRCYLTAVLIASNSPSCDDRKDIVCEWFQELIISKLLMKHLTIVSLLYDLAGGSAGRRGQHLLPANRVYSSKLKSH